ncbi:MAG: hypothetical protein RBU21_01640 [FCB group bacterium]|jgi:type II secretory pathway component PulJ|nr:hypothetical protein [FCB group bacterium]
MKNPRRAGYMLIEALAVVSILAIVLGLAGQILITCTRLSTFGTRAADRIEQAAEVEETFRAAVRESFAVSPGVGPYRSDANTLVLETPSGAGRRFVVLGRIREPERLSVLKAVEKEGVFETEYLSTSALPVKSLSFAYDAADPAQARRITLYLEPQGQGKTSAAREIVATPGAVAQRAKP